MKVIEQPSTNGRDLTVYECPVCGEEFSELGIEQHWWGMHDEVIPRPWWPPVHESKRNGPRYKWARRQVLNRDNNRCQRCGVHSSEADRIEVHHIIPFTNHEIPGWAHRPENLMTFCKDCHTSVEGLTPQELKAVLQVESHPSEGRIRRPGFKNPLSWVRKPKVLDTQ